MLSLFIEYVISIYFPKISTIIFFHPPLIQEKILTLLSCKYCYANAGPSIFMKQSRLPIYGLSLTVNVAQLILKSI